MHSSTAFSTLAAAAATLLSSATSTSPIRASTNNSVKCTDISTGLAPACWLTLNMTAYLNNWVATSPYNTSISTDDATAATPFTDTVSTGGLNSSSWFRKRTAAADPASGQCQGGKPFSTCFLQLLPGYRPGSNRCSVINTGGANVTCSAPKVADYPHDLQTYYAAWNFYSINTYLSTLHQSLPRLSRTTNNASALLSAATFASHNIPYTNNETLSIDHPLLTLLIRSATGHQLWGDKIAPFLQLLKHRPSRVTYEVDTVTAEQLVPLLQARVEELLEGVMRDERVFVYVAGNGAFSTSEEEGKVDWVGALGGGGVGGWGPK